MNLVDDMRKFNFMSFPVLFRTMEQFEKDLETLSCERKQIHGQSKTAEEIGRRHGVNGMKLVAVILSKRLKKRHPDRRKALLFLIDSLLKNANDYRMILENELEFICISCFTKGCSSTRRSIWKLLQSWEGIVTKKL